MRILTITALVLLLAACSIRIRGSQPRYTLTLLYTNNGNGLLEACG